jgi:hypothetical protein
VNVSDPADSLQEIGEIVRFRKTSKLRSVVQSNVNNFLYAGLEQTVEETFCGCLCKTDS